MQTPSGSGPEWLAAIGTTAAFVATSWVIFRDHRLRRVTSNEEALDEALLVSAKAAPAGDYSTPPDVKTVVMVTVTNKGRRAIRDVDVEARTLVGRVSQVRLPLVQADWHSPVTFPA